MTKQERPRGGKVEGKDGKKKGAFVIRQSFDEIGRESISLVSTAVREIGKQDVEALTKADKTMLLRAPGS